MTILNCFNQINNAYKSKRIYLKKLKNNNI